MTQTRLYQNLNKFLLFPIYIKLYYIVVELQKFIVADYTDRTFQQLKRFRCVNTQIAYKDSRDTIDIGL